MLLHKGPSHSLQRRVWEHKSHTSQNKTPNMFPEMTRAKKPRPRGLPNWKVELRCCRGHSLSDRLSLTRHSNTSLRLHELLLSLIHAWQAEMRPHTGFRRR